MALTQNYQLYVEDGGETTFAEWRAKLNGTAGSNMVKIDTALAQKADKSVAVEAVLTAAGWVGSSAPYTQTVAVASLTADSNGEAVVSMNATADERSAARDALLGVTGQAAGALTVSADGELPSRDIPITIVIFG